MKLSLGDILEPFAAGAATTAAAIKWGSFAAFIVAAVSLFYLAQCHAKTPVPWPKQALLRVKWFYKRQLALENEFRKNPSKRPAKAS
jgi:hypothetical protein